MVLVIFILGAKEEIVDREDLFGSATEYLVLVAFVVVLCRL